MLHNESPVLLTKIASQYKNRTLTSVLYDDFKEIKKLNSLFEKAIKNENNAFEVINHLKMLSNKLYIENLSDVFIEMVDINYHQTILYLVNNIKNYNNIKNNIKILEDEGLHE